ncbi:flagellar hook-associated protein FlgK [Schinkia sp. CFF1]
MTSTFHGLEVARRGMMAQQAALYTTSHNIANANTPGYTRQRVNFVQTDPYPSASRNRPQIPGQMGTGVETGSIQRIRDSFLDDQYRTENNKFGYWNTKSEALTKMEDIMNEPSEDGLATTINEFWGALQDLSAQPEDSGARSVVRQRALAVADTFKYVSNSLSAIQKDLDKQIDVEKDNLNAILEKIGDLNKQINEVEPHGYVPNDLYDERDRLVDELSNSVSIRVERVKSSGKPDDIAEGKYNIFLTDGEGKDLVPPVKIVDGDNLKVAQMKYTKDNSLTYSPVDTISFVDKDTGAVLQNFNAKDFNSPGKLQAFVEAYGYVDGGKATGIYPDMLHDLDLMAVLFVDKFNEIHRAGSGLPQLDSAGIVVTPGATGLDFFEPFTMTAANPNGAASQMKLSSNIELDLNNIAASTNGTSGDGSNAKNLANIKDVMLDFDQDGVPENSAQSFYQSKIGKMGVDTQLADRMTKNSTTLKDSVETRRNSISNVSLDEEMTDMIRFQHAYNAAARNITLIDELLDKVINGMGVGGR